MSETTLRSLVEDLTIGTPPAAVSRNAEGVARAHARALGNSLRVLSALGYSAEDIADMVRKEFEGASYSAAWKAGDTLRADSL